MKSEHPSIEEIVGILKKITGATYQFAYSSERVWNSKKNKCDTKLLDEGYVQLRPNGADHGFFQWYCHHRKFNQFFLSKADCALEFINYYYLWEENIKIEA